MNIWELCHGNKHIQAMQYKTWRVVEAQHQITTRCLTDNLAEHALLETILENSKPDIGEAENLHYLLFTPFRYPPLKYGSRFCTRAERGIWYGSTDVRTALHETAYYRYLFCQDTDPAEYHDGLSSLHTAFSVNVKTKSGLELIKPPFKDYRENISNPNAHECSQLLGSRMRHAGIEAFSYYSARSVDLSANIGVFNPNAFQEKSPNPEYQTWSCRAYGDKIEFTHNNPIYPVTEVFNFKN